MKIREATCDDLRRGLWDLANVFRFKDDACVDDMPLEDQQVLYQKSLSPFAKVYAVENDEGQILATAKLLIEEKLHHCGHPVAHIEDLVVDPACRGKGVGTFLLDHLKEEAKKFGAYKLLLNARVGIHEFYLKNGFTIQGYEMGIRFID